MDTAFENRLARMVAQKDVSRERRRFGISSVLIAILAAGLSVIFGRFAELSAQSGFSAYVSLLVSDTSHVFAYFGDFVLSLAESTPVFLLALFFLALSGIGYAVQKAGRAFRRAHVIHLIKF